MKAAILTAPGRPLFGEIDRPEASGAVRKVDVLLAGVNPIDLQLASATTGPFPQVPGREGIGLLDGRRVYFPSAPGPWGSMAETALTQPERCFEVPDGVSSSDALALGICGLTAWLSVADRGRLASGETVVVLGASGMVGRLAIQAARELGAGRVIAVTRQAAALAEFNGYGADIIVEIDGKVEDQLSAEIRDACNGRLDLIIDPVWGMPAVAALKAATGGGRLIQIGHSAAASVSLAPAFMRGTSASILGYSSSSASLELRRSTYARLCALTARGRMSVPTKVLPLSQVDDAWRLQAISPHSKLCLAPGT